MADYPKAYCAKIDVERYAGETYSSTRTPSDTQVQAFAQEVASDLTTIVRTAGYTVLPADGAGTSQVPQVTQDGKDLANLLRTANALGAAARAKRAAFLGQPPSDAQEVISDLEADYFRYAGGKLASSGGASVQDVEGKIVAFLRAAFPVTTPGSSGANSHIISGEVLPPIVTTQPQSPGIRFDMDFRN